MYYSEKNNVNNQYLTNVFCVAFEHGLNLPVYQVNFEDEDNLTSSNTPSSPHIVMICGNENHNSVNHYLDNPYTKMVIKNYPRIINVSKEPDVSQTYKTFVNKDNQLKFVVEKEPENTFTIPLGPCNNYNPIPNKPNRDPGGFIGQWTQLRQTKLESIRSCFPPDTCPYDFAFYKGFGPFVQQRLPKNKEASLTTEVYSNFMSNSELAIIPSGQSPETYRLFEAALAGCIAVHDILPDIWYYDNLPYLPLQYGDFLPIKEYVENYKSELQILTSIWWQSTISPIALGKNIAHVVKTLGI